MDNSNVINRFFSKNTLQHFIAGNMPENIGSVISRCQLSINNKTNYQIISEIYSFLNKEHRNEYFYKNTLLNELIVHSPIHTVENTSAIIELPVETSKLDFLLINGRAVVYEIKTELDNFERLNSQINDYYKAFDHVVVITSVSYLDKLNDALKFSPTVGISIIDNNEKIQEIKTPIKNTDFLTLSAIFKILRKKEFEDIITISGFELPKVSQFEYYRKCEEIFLSLEISYVYPLFLKKLKARTKILKEPFLKLPYEVKTLGYFSNLKTNDYNKLDIFFNSNIKE